MSLYKRLHEQPSQPPSNGDPFNPDIPMAADGVTPLHLLPPPPGSAAPASPLPPVETTPLPPTASVAPAPLPPRIDIGLPSPAEPAPVDERTLFERLGASRPGRAAIYAGKMCVNGFYRSVGDFPKHKIHPVRAPLEAVVVKPAKAVLGKPASAVGNKVMPSRRRARAAEERAREEAMMAGPSAAERKQLAIPQILEHNLSYADVLPADDVHIPQTNEAVVYAGKLFDLYTNKPGELDAAQDEIRARFETMKSMLPDEHRELSRYADSSSWILWDIAKQEVYSIRSYRSPDTKINYAGSAVDSSVLGISREEAYERTDFMRDVIAWRHLGWELHQQMLDGKDLSWLDGMLPDKARELLHTTGDDNHNGQLSSVLLAELGRYIDEALQRNARVERRGSYLDRI